LPLKRKKKQASVAKAKGCVKGEKNQKGGRKLDRVCTVARRSSKEKKGEIIKNRSPKGGRNTLAPKLLGQREKLGSRKNAFVSKRRKLEEKMKDQTGSGAPKKTTQTERKLGTKNQLNCGQPQKTPPKKSKLKTKRTKQ